MNPDVNRDFAELVNGTWSDEAQAWLPVKTAMANLADLLEASRAHRAQLAASREARGGRLCGAPTKSGIWTTCHIPTFRGRCRVASHNPLGPVKPCHHCREVAA